MDPFRTLTALVAPLDRADVDTDAILPKYALRSLSKRGYADYLFAAWRYQEPADLAGGGGPRVLNPDFVLNAPRYQGAQILLCRQNFGCGSSREQAPWALRDYGFRAMIAPSYGQIFYDNSLKNGLLPVVLAEPLVGRLFAAVLARPGYQLTVDLPGQRVQTPDGEEFGFGIDAFRKRCLMESLDDISYVLGHVEEIRAFEAARQREAPWLFGNEDASVPQK